MRKPFKSTKKMTNRNNVTHNTKHTILINKTKFTPYSVPPAHAPASVIILPVKYHTMVACFLRSYVTRAHFIRQVYQTSLLVLFLYHTCPGASEIEFWRFPTLFVKANPAVKTYHTHHKSGMLRLWRKPVLCTVRIRTFGVPGQGQTLDVYPRPDFW
jgi:hypothetical protein